MPIFYFAMPGFYILAVYILAAVLPAWFLLRYIYRHDTVEKEPAGLLASLLLMGVAAALCSGVLEGLGEAVLYRLADPGSPLYTVFLAFFVVALVEEGTKFLFLRARTWRNPNFNYRFDGVVYAVFVSLGFAAFENVLYVFQYGLSVALPRAILSIPGHMGFAVFMGAFYSRARLRFFRRQPMRSRINLAAGYLIAVFLHGVYDTCCLIGSNTSTLAFLAFVAVMYLVVYATIRRESRKDRPIL